MADRARAFACRLGPAWTARLVFRRATRAASVRAFRDELASAPPDVTYVMDMGVDAVTAALWHRATHRTSIVVDTGDAITALARSSGLRGPAGVAATWLLERTALRAADRLVVRGTGHRELLAQRGISATVVPDGVDLRTFRPVDANPIRTRYGLQGAFVVGLVGSSVWSPRLGIAYGWDLVEMLGRLRDLPVRGVVVGSGSGIERLAARARALGIEDRLLLAGRRPLNELPQWLAAFDVCLSTQTNDVPGQVRTTGKLPLYLACGRYVLASRVGEAARILPPEMLVPYQGTVDREYPARLADRVRHLVAHPAALHAGATGVALAKRRFDYDMLARRLEAVLDAACTGMSVAARAS